MEINPQHSLNAIKLLQSKLDDTSHLEVMDEDGTVWSAYFSFAPPAPQESVEAVKARWNLPPTYEQFLLHFDGALLYRDDVYGQWGYRLYGTEELIPMNETWQGLYSNGWSPAYLVFAECFGDADLLLLDIAHLSNTAGESYVLDGDTGCPVPTWGTIAPSFGQWLNRLIVAQGAKYWRWHS